MAVFLLWREIFITTEKKRYITTGKKIDTVVCLMGARFWRLRPEKKETVVCLTGCAVVLFFVVAGNFDYDRKKKRYSRLLAGNWQFFCCGGKFSLRPEKKRYSRLSGGCAIIITTGKKKHTVVCLVGARSCLSFLSRSLYLY